MAATRTIAATTTNTALPMSIMAGMDGLVEEDATTTPLAAWKREQVAQMANNVEATERQIEDSVWKKINALPENQRNDLLHTLTTGNDPRKHPIFANIFQQVFSDLQPQSQPQQLKPQQFKPQPQKNQTSVLMKE
jgi:hypothetical protein